MLLIRQWVMGGLLPSVAHSPLLLVVVLPVVVVDVAVIVLDLLMAWLLTYGRRLVGNCGTSGVLMLPRKIFPSMSLLLSAPTARSDSAWV